MKNPFVLSDEGREFIQANHSTYTVKQMADHLDMKVYSVYKALKILCLDTYNPTENVFEKCMSGECFEVSLGHPELTWLI